MLISLLTSLLVSVPKLGESAEGLSVGFARSQYEAPAVPLKGNSKFLVAFVNGSRKPIVTLAESCSWGYECLCFQVVNPAGSTYLMTRKPKVWDKNYPIPVNLDPGAVVFRAINLDDGTWQGFPAGVAGQVNGWKVRVVLTVTPERLLTDRGFWTGKITSPWSAATR